MPRIVPALLLAAAVAAPSAVAAAAAPTASRTAAPSSGIYSVVERFGSDPFAQHGSSRFFLEGDAGRFTFLGNVAPHFPADRRGTLRVLYDTTRPTGRIAMPLRNVLALDDDFGFGAILTIRSHGFAADPQGFSQIAFGLWNAHTTGLGRTLFPSDSYDLLEFDYFANVTDFGGPFLSPSVFGGNVGDNAFFNFAFQSTETALPFDVPLLCQFTYVAATRRLTVTVSRHTSGSHFQPIPGATATVDLSRVNPGFLLNVLGIAGYGEGYTSLRAEVDYDLIYFGALPAPFGVNATGRTIAMVPPEPLP
jgi:hypothetical protein